MKRIITFVILICCLLLTACNSKSVGIIGGADGPTSITVAEKTDASKYFKENYVDKFKLPMLDVHIENPYLADDRTLVLDDSIENNIEFIIYEYYKNCTAGDYSKVKEAVAGDTLLLATENEEKRFKDGAYFSKIVIDDIELIEKDELGKIDNKNKEKIVEQLSKLNAEEFAIVEVEKTVKLNEKYNAQAPQIGDGEWTRYYLLGKIDGTYKIVEVFWDGFIRD